MTPQKPDTMKYWITIGILTLIVAGIIVVNLKDKPECYITTENKCMVKYDFVPMINYWTMDFSDEQGSFNVGYKQCCKKPNYVMQTIEPTLYVMKTFCDEVNKTPYGLVERK